MWALCDLMKRGFGDGPLSFFMENFGRMEKVNVV
jgi:hypothetical protein